MRFLACVTTSVSDGEKWALAGEPVMPNFPTGYANSFLGADTFRPAMRAEVRDFPGLDIDKLARKLCEQFPGLPKRMLDAYVLETAKAAHELPLGAECNVYTTWDTAKIMDLATGKIHVMWDRLPE